MREEFTSNVDMNKLIVFSEKPFSSYRVLRFCTRGDSILDCVMGLAGEDELEQRDFVFVTLLEEKLKAVLVEGTMELISKKELLLST